MLREARWAGEYVDAANDNPYDRADVAQDERGVGGSARSVGSERAARDGAQRVRA